MSADDDKKEEVNLAVLTRQHVEAVILERGMEEAWKALGVGRTTLYRWRRKWRREDRAAGEGTAGAATAKEES